MTIEDLKNAGYRVSLHADPKEVEAAVADARSCYADRLVSGLDTSDADYAAAVMAVTYILLCRRRTVATRSGGKSKNTPLQSETADVTQEDIEKADRLLRVLQTKPGGIPGYPSKLCDDIACIYFRTRFFGN